MDDHGAEGFDRRARAAAAALPLLDCCGALLGRIEAEIQREARKARRDPQLPRRRLADPVLSEAYALVARLEGRPADDPLLGWALGGLPFVSDDAAAALAAAGIVTVGDLTGRTPADLIGAGLDARSLGEIRRGLLGLGLALARPAGPPPPAHPIYAATIFTFLPLTWCTPPLAGLYAAGIVTVADLAGRTAGDLLEVSGIGPRTVEALEEELRVYGLALAASSAAGAVA